ncbi:transcriptional regulator [Burkholderia sp. Bp9140]|uniref:transcriptional regulator n=1 Tax=Burkholderia sp. Bp9140 TaxID=2184572 RepID=UPI000F565C55|nr:transcriptional regulator [Burkholderia sp. Bp9140]RQR47439.1 transcriptional regulator [Burkholderia sp. Bp9140]
MSDHDVKAYAQQVKHPPGAAHSATAAKPGQQPVRSPSKAPAAAHADAKPVSKAHATPAEARKVQHVVGADPKVHAAAKPKAARAARTSAAIPH